MSTVHYHGHKVSDVEIRRILKAIADLYGKPVEVTSGDRSFVPKGGAKHSLHLEHRAADLYVHGLTLQNLFDGLKTHIAEIFDPNSGYEVIYHGTYTATGGPHVHIGHYGHHKHKGNVLFKTEGLVPSTKGAYSTHTQHIPLKVDGASVGSSESVLV